jgi:hypothetical protein
MKLVTVMLLVCAFSLTLLALFPKTHPNAKVAKRSALTLFGDCKDFGPNEESACDHPACGTTVVMENNGNFSGNGTYSLAMRSTDCKGNPPGCVEFNYSYLARVDDNTCCDLDNDGYYGSQCEGTDCDDTNANKYPGNEEVCDGIDNNCNGQTDEGFDQDQDGWKTCNGDCDDYNAEINPAVDPCVFCGNLVADKNCNNIDDYWECQWSCQSPIVIDVQGNGFNLTNAITGVNFDLNSDGRKERLSWTAPNSDDAWLALDRNSNGLVDNGQELFGNFTPQPQPPPSVLRNGFLALAEYDKPSKGGNNDGQIDSRDAIFTSLRLWQDTNHNGISEPTELRTLTAVGLATLDLDYKESKRVDQHGNSFKYRAKVKDVSGAQVGRWAWDVFLVRGR